MGWQKNPLLAFQSKYVIDAETGCFNWVGRLFDKRGGYGVFTHRPSGQIMRRAHRVAWEMEHGALQRDQHVLHRCDNPRCVNVEHLFLGTPRVNMHDMAAKGRQAQGARHGVFKHGLYVGQKKNHAYPSEPV